MRASTPQRDLGQSAFIIGDGTVSAAPSAEAAESRG